MDLITLESPLFGSSIFICSDDKEFFPDGFNAEKLNQVIDDLKQNGWTLNPADPAGLKLSEPWRGEKVVENLYK